MPLKNKANIAVDLQEQYKLFASHQVHLQASMELKYKELRKMMDLKQSKLLQMINSLKDVIDEKQLMLQLREKCLCSIDCRCAACTDNCLRESFHSFTIQDLNSCTEGITIGKFEIGMSTSYSVVIDSIETLGELFLDEFFMESESLNNTSKVFDKITKRTGNANSFGSSFTEENYGFEIIKDMYLNRISREPTVCKLDFVIPDSIRELDELLELDIRPTSCLLTASSYYIFEKKNDVTVAVFDPGGSTLDVLKFSYMKFIDSYFSLLLNVGSGSWLRSCEEFHYICGTMKTLGLPKGIDSVNQ